MTIAINNSYSKFSICLIFCFTLFFIACTKEKKCNSGNKSTTATISTPPSQFEARAVIEMFGGEWCSTCPAGVDKVEELVTANPGDVFGVIVHYRDPFETEHHNELFNHLGGIASYPSASINRESGILADTPTQYAVYNRQYWESNLNRFIHKKTNLGLAIATNITEGKANIEVHIHGTDIPVDLEYFLTVYYLEDKVPSIAQVGKGLDYTHRMLLRGSLTKPLGNVLLIKANETNIEPFSFNITSGIKAENIKILAFVHTKEGGNSMRSIINAQQVKLGETADWD